MEEKVIEWESVFDSDITTPPLWALKEIKGGRLKGFTDINPQWRIEAMTKKYGLCGQGWSFSVERIWSEPAANGEVFAFAEVAVYVKDTETGEWGKPVQGFGGSMLISQERDGLYSQDEGYKMAITDALSVALKFYGVGAKVYAGAMDNNGASVKTNSDSKYAVGEKRGYQPLELPPEDKLLEFLTRCDKPTAYYRLVKDSSYSDSTKKSAYAIMYPNNG